MAEVAFAGVVAQINGDVYRAGPLAAGDTTSILTLNDSDTDLTVHMYGTAGGSTTAIMGGIASVAASFGAVDDAFGSVLSTTTLPLIKPVGPALRQLQGTVTGGAGSGIYIDVYVTHRRA